MADIRHAVFIAAQVEAIYPLIATGAGFRQWWAADVTEPAGTVELGFFNRTTVYRLKSDNDHSPTLATWTCVTGDEWSGTRIVFRLEVRGAGALLRFMHAGWRDESEYFVSCNTTWGELLYRLKAVAEGKARGPLFLKADLAY